MSVLVPLLFASPWLLVPIVTVVRGHNSRSLDDESGVAPVEAPLVSLVIPARNEARNIAKCVDSALASSYPRLEIIAVDDHSTDATAAILHDLQSHDARLRVVTPAALPPGWFGKQWACAAGASIASGDILGFMDADTWQAPDLVTRIVNGMLSRRADFLTVAGTQHLGSFWERLIQPQIFGIMAARYGGTESVNASPRVTDKIANGQCIFVRRGPYEALGGHGSVRGKVAEDLALAQLYFVRGLRSFVVLGQDQLFTRMYTSFRELRDGWGKNVFAGGRDAMFGGRVGLALYPILLLSPALIPVVAFLLAVLGAAGLASGALFVWGTAVSVALLAWFFFVLHVMRVPKAYALLFPLGAVALLYILARSVLLGRKVRWKDRAYVVDR